LQEIEETVGSEISEKDKRDFDPSLLIARTNLRIPIKKPNQEK
jgi:hypothetical protein